MIKSKNKISILFIYESLSSFVKKDLEILQRHYDVLPLQLIGKRSIPKIAFSVLRSDITFSWFASDFAAITVFFSKLFKKISIIVAGGYDVAYVPEINYGNFTKGWYKKIFTKFALNYADIVLPFSKFSKKEILKRSKPKNIKLNYIGVDIKRFNGSKFKKKEIVLTVGGIKWNNLKRKGIETFVKSAQYLPDKKFVVAGKFLDNSIEYLKSIASSNVEFTGFISDEKLIKLYQRAKVYVQASAHEGFGLAMAEAMACEAIPVVTRRGAIPEVVGNTGLYIEYDNPGDAAEKIKEAFHLSSSHGKTARKRIEENFPLSKREKEFIDIINYLLQIK